MRLNNHLKHQRVSGLFILLMFAGLSIASHSVQANPFATNITSPPNTCPVDHKMYYVGRTPPAYTPKTTMTLIWPSGDRDKQFIFEDNKIMRLIFSEIDDAVAPANLIPFFGGGQLDGNGYGVYDRGNENTKDAINLRHGRQVGQNHVFNLQVNRNVSKMGYKIQDLDSEGFAATTYYTQQADVSNSNGFLTFNDVFHNVYQNNTIVSAKRRQGCALNECTIDASWKYTPADTQVSLIHSNIYNFSLGSSNHIVGYSDFYFCLAPPKVIIKKALNGARIIDTGNNSDQFEIEATGGSIAANSFTTTGTGATITNGSSAVLSLAENKSYTITERVMNGTTLGNIANYDATYTCNNATTGSTTVMPTDAMTYDATAKTRSFTLANATYGDEITCTITNTPKPYTFSGTVFNDNGGITSPDSELVGGIYNNANFFNGVFDANESGIDGMDVVKARLSDCSNNPSANPIIATVNVTSLGKYSFAVSARDLAGKTNLCIEEIEPPNWIYSVDTTPNIRKFSFDPSVLTYQTGVKINGNTLNLDFGNVIKENTALVLIKSQYVHDCSLTDLTTIGVNYSGLATAAYSTKPIADIEPGQCIAYRIEAINRGNVPITDIVIRDTLQKSGDRNAVVTSTLVNPAPIGEISDSGAPTFSTGSVTIGNTGTVITNRFILGTNASNNRKAIRFNTKYGSVVYQ